MSYSLREYQKRAVQAAIEFYQDRRAYNGIEIIPTGAGKSLIIAEVAKELNQPTLVLQPSKEILEQNYSKYTAYGYEAGIYSASMGRKDLGDVTFATIGSIIRKPELFSGVGCIIQDECHITNAKGGMYDDLFKMLPGAKVLGLTATPYRLSTSSVGSVLKFITRTKPRVFSEVLYTVQVGELFRDGFLCPLEYNDDWYFDRKAIRSNSTGAEFDDESLRAYMQHINFYTRLRRAVQQYLEEGKPMCIFTKYTQQARRLASEFPTCEMVSADTPTKERAALLQAWKNGEVQALANVGILTTGIDYPELSTVLLGRPTKSLALYYQMVGRVMRPHPTKAVAKVVDLCGNVKAFGKIEDMAVGRNSKGLYEITNKGRVLTNVVL